MWLDDLDERKNGIDRTLQKIESDYAAHIERGKKIRAHADNMRPFDVACHDTKNKIEEMFSEASESLPDNTTQAYKELVREVHGIIDGLQDNAAFWTGIECGLPEFR